MAHFSTLEELRRAMVLRDFVAAFLNCEGIDTMLITSTQCSEISLKGHHPDANESNPRADSGMTEAPQDVWSRWLLHRRDADNSEAKRLALEYLRPIRDRVLDNAGVNEADTLLDVGCGDGLVAFGALERTKTGTVIFSDISQDLLAHCRAIAEDLGVVDRSHFVMASAEYLSQVPDASVSVVTTRSVLIYVQEKATAFSEFHRVLTQGGRFSLFEPINSFGYPEPDQRFAGYDVARVADLARKVKAV